MVQFETVLTIGGKSNSLGKADEVIAEVLNDRSRLGELYGCMFSEDAWVRMRAADAFEKVCREHPEWIEPYIDRIQAELSDPGQQASIQWHIAQIYPQVSLNDEQKRHALTWLAGTLSSNEIDWIVAANAMKTLVYFTEQGDFAKEKLMPLLRIQLQHKSNAVVKRANKFIGELSQAG
jgi:hypothetical protein